MDHYNYAASGQSRIVTRRLGNTDLYRRAGIERINPDFERRDGQDYLLFYNDIAIAYIDLPLAIVFNFVHNNVVLVTRPILIIEIFED